MEEHIASLYEVPRTPWCVDSGIKVLGLPVCYPGSHAFARDILADLVAKLDTSCKVLTHLGDAQVEQLLLRYCLDACRITHFLRGVDCTALEDELRRASSTIRRTLESTLGSPMTDDHWVQATLPLRHGGLGIKDPLVVVTPARVAAILSYSLRGPELGLGGTTGGIPPDWGSRVTSLRSLLGGRADLIQA